jgi:hypothetical protein
MNGRLLRHLLLACLLACFQQSRLGACAGCWFIYLALCCGGCICSCVLFFSFSCWRVLCENGGTLCFHRFPHFASPPEPLNAAFLVACCLDLYTHTTTFPIPLTHPHHAHIYCFPKSTLQRPAIHPSSSFLLTLQKTVMILGYCTAHCLSPCFYNCLSSSKIQHLVCYRACPRTSPTAQNDGRGLPGEELPVAARRAPTITHLQNLARGLNGMNTDN